ncbi:hypothetical protein Lal_00012857 [Lupinus albus]|nr:hypothetical protein Lal_00012857 [Lupinus albus]
MTPKSPYRRGCLAPRCRLIASWGWSRSQGYGCSPFKAVRELGSERRETVRSLSAVGVGILTGSVPTRSTSSFPLFMFIKQSLMTSFFCPDARRAPDGPRQKARRTSVLYGCHARSRARQANGPVTERRVIKIKSGNATQLLETTLM